MTTHALAVRESMLPDPQTWSTMLDMAGALVQSGLLPTHIKNPQAAVAVIQKGRELGIPPMHALSAIAVINGKPVCSAELMLALIYRDHGDHAVRVEQSDDAVCTVAYRRRGWGSAQTFSFTIEEAKRAGLIKQGPWTQYPPAMLRARCISAVARMAFPDTIGGMYTPEELGAEVAVAPDGEIAVVTLPEAQPAPEPTPREQRRAQAMTAQARLSLAHQQGSREELVSQYTKLARLAIDNQHPKADAIASTDPSSLTDAQLRRTIQTLDAWLTRHLAEDAEDGDEAF